MTYLLSYSEARRTMSIQKAVARERERRSQQMHWSSDSVVEMYAARVGAAL